MSLTESTARSTSRNQYVVLAELMKDGDEMCTHAQTNTSIHLLSHIHLNKIMNKIYSMTYS